MAARGGNSELSHLVATWAAVGRMSRAGAPWELASGVGLGWPLLGCSATHRASGGTDCCTAKGRRVMVSALSWAEAVRMLPVLIGWVIGESWVEEEEIDPAFGDLLRMWLTGNKLVDYLK
mmetsp:Transcript_66033/g.176927  ORF Transcript_66033/g.176927 Transcript_66033/m.176927 type:complete len:120 (+) Transcript_66033:88-447(+)